MYFVFSTSEDGIYFQALSREKLEEMLAEDYWGDRVFITNAPEHSDVQYWGSGILIIKGEIITPRVEKVVTQWRVP